MTLPRTVSRAVEAVLFDLDGTLVESLPTIALAMQHTLERFGYQRSIEEIYALIGPPIEVMAQQVGAGAEESIRIGIAYREAYDHGYIQQTQPREGAAALLDGLDAAGIPYAIVTNKVEYSGLMMLDIMGWLERVRLLLGRDTAGAAPKPDPQAAHFALRALRAEASHAAFVGDTEFDMQCGRDAGMAMVVGVLGARTEEQLRESGATHVVPDLDAVRTLLLGAAVPR